MLIQQTHLHYRVCLVDKHRATALLTMHFLKLRLKDFLVGTYEAINSLIYNNNMCESEITYGHLLEPALSSLSIPCVPETRPGVSCIEDGNSLEVATILGLESIK